ncbi:hypothetical protein MD484_g6239, partial [Candolleomyces efflorescens]
MPPKSKDKENSGLLSRLSSLFRGRRSKSATHGLAATVNTGVGSSQSDRLPAHSVLDSTHPGVNSSTLQCHEYHLPAIPSPRTQNNDSVDLPQHASDHKHLEGPPQPFPVFQPSDDQLTYGNHGATTSLFQGARKFQTGDVHVHMSDKQTSGWDLLLRHAAPNALHNSSARYDAPNCDEDTRVEVTSEIMEFIQDRGAPLRLLCMTGAAGSGKSCLQQTAAENCAENGNLAASFFLSTQDPTRSIVNPVIPTIAYQLGRTNATLKRLINDAIERDPLIFSQSLEAQTAALIAGPVERLRDHGVDIRRLPFVILIDGLDECNGEDRQAELLTAIRRCLLADHLPFRIFIASRPEWAIRTALEPGGHLREMAYHIQLSDKYDASEDMRRYLQRRFYAIGLGIDDPDWFTEEDVETLVQAGSGQFIYVATVYKYVSERRASPPARLKVVLTWTPSAAQSAKPFEALDKLYYNILLAAKNTYEAVDTHHDRDFLLLLRALVIGGTGGFHLGCEEVSDVYHAADEIAQMLCLEARAEKALISDLRSLMALDRRRKLFLYHKSFPDFLREPSRAKDLYVSEIRVYTHLAKCLMQHIVEFPLDINSLPSKWDELPLAEAYKNSLGDALYLLPFSLYIATEIDEALSQFTQSGGWQNLEKLFPLGSTWLSIHFKLWTEFFCHFSERVKVSLSVVPPSG